MNKIINPANTCAALVLSLGIAVLLFFLKNDAQKTEIASSVKNTKQKPTKSRYYHRENVIPVKGKNDKVIKSISHQSNTSRTNMADMTVVFGNDLSILITPTDSKSRIQLSEKDLYFYKKMLASESCGEFIGIELVGGDGTYLSLKESAYQGVFYNRDGSSIGVPPHDLDSNTKLTKTPDIKISLVDLVSRLKPDLRSDGLLKQLEKSGLRFRLRANLPANGAQVFVISDWVQVSDIARQNLIEYLESE